MNKQIYTNNFGEGIGKMFVFSYDKDLPMRLDRWLVMKLKDQSRARIQKFINSQYVRINGINGQAKTPLRKDDQVYVWIPPPEPLSYLKPEEMDLDILYEDDHLIVINKPAGLTVHPAPGHKDGTLVNGLLYHCRDLPGISGKLRPGIVHRLDRYTSGCIVVAKTQESLLNLQSQIQNRTAKREYLGLVYGRPNSDSGTIIAAIGRHPSDRKKYSVVTNSTGRYACTHWSLLEKIGDYSLLKFKLDTGRTHQIRVHCAHIKHPIVGDQVYSRGGKLPVIIPGQALHAFQLGFIHPASKEDLVFRAPLPYKLQKLLNSIRLRACGGRPASMP